MENKVDFVLVLLVGLAVVAVHGCSLRASPTAVLVQAGRSIVDGVYTETQAKRGENVYADTCAVCHGPDLKGSDFVPSLVGPPFMGTWEDRTAGELFEKIKSSMPAVAPGTLTPEQSVDLVAYLLSVGQYPPGSTELPAAPEELETIRIEPSKP